MSDSELTTTMKPREWWTDGVAIITQDEEYISDVIKEDSWNEFPIKVIEYAAYQALEQENAKLRDEKYKNCEIVDVMELEAENAKLRQRLLVLQKYHSGDGTITREEVLKVLGGQDL